MKVGDMEPYRCITILCIDEGRFCIPELRAYGYGSIRAAQDAIDVCLDSPVDELLNKLEAYHG